MSQFNFDQIIERRGTDSFKWGIYEQDVLPLWVADMDFLSPPAVMEALHRRVDHGVFGYALPMDELKQVIVDRMNSLYRWQIDREAIQFIPGIVSGLNQFCHAFQHTSKDVIVQTPVYPPFLEAPGNAGLNLVDATLVRGEDGRYEIDFEALEARMKAGARLFLLCSPHNPIGRVFTRTELERIAELCNRYDVTLCSDEIHGDLVFAGHPHTPIAALDGPIGSRTITFLAPSKTYNVAGLDCAVAIIPNPDLRRQFEAGNQGLVPHVNILGYTAALAAFRDGAEWLSELLIYLQSNRDCISEYFRQNHPEIGITPAEGTYLAWLDCRDLHLPEAPSRFFLKDCKVALNNGGDFGKAGEGFVRMNFGCPRSTLIQAMERITAGIRKIR